MIGDVTQAFLELISILNNPVISPFWIDVAATFLVFVLLNIYLSNSPSSLHRIMNNSTSPDNLLFQYFTFLFITYIVTHQNPIIVSQEFSPGSNGRVTTMGVYVRDLLLGQVCCIELLD